MKILIILAFLVFCSIASAQPAVPGKSLPPRVPQSFVSESTTADQIRDAANLGKPLVVYVGTVSLPVAGATTLRADDHGKPGIYVYRPDGKGWFGTGERFDLDTDHELIQAAIAPRVVSRPAIPFAERKQRIAEDDLSTAGRWSPGIEKPSGLVRYKRAQYTQEIATTNGRPRITPVHRLNLESRWHQSGGMDGITGWRSDVYRLIEAEPYQARLPVLNSFGFFQNELGWTRVYPPNARFDDVLSNTETGKVFEHRTATKAKGVWTRRVIYSDETQRPADYTGLTVTCASCHDSFPGSGGYASALVMGADGVFSDPFPSLEQ